MSFWAQLADGRICRVDDLPPGAMAVPATALWPIHGPSGMTEVWIAELPPVPEGPEWN